MEEAENMDDLTQSGPKMTWFKAVLFLGMLLFAFYASTHMVAAGDTWVALACGRHFANQGVDTVEPFSFNSHPAGPSEEQLEKFPEWTHGLIRTWHPTGWLNQNWLTHLGFYKLVTWFDHDQYNYNALVYWKFALYFITVFAVYGIGKTLGAGDILSAAAACLAMVVGRSFYDIRPAGYSNMLVPVFVLILALTMAKNFRWIWLVVPLVVFWANVHGGYIYAFIMFVPFIGINLLLKLPRRWTLCLGLSGLWLLMYAMSHKFVTHQYYLIVEKAIHQTSEEASFFNNSLFYGWLIAVVISFSLTIVKKVPAGLFYGYHYLAGFLLFISIILRFVQSTPSNFNDYFENIYSYFVSSSQMSYVFVFIAGTLIISSMAFKKEVFIYLPTKGLYHVIGAGIVSLVAMVILNPFHLTNITHTFEISVSKHAESWRSVNEWKPAFDFMDKTTEIPNPVGQELWFGIMCILMLVGLSAWFAGYFMKLSENKRTGSKKIQQSSIDPAETFTWPKIDLAVIVIALLTIYMAIRSRRFISLAGSAAAPVLALFILQAWQMISTRIQFVKNGIAKPWVLPVSVQYGINGVITFVLICLTFIWGGKYKRIYLDPWPTDHQYNSAFMRITASHLKPTDACQFLRDNKVSGKVFNYWTEGGAVAFGQTPDPETGFIPLKLFMDGRAQAAYNHDKFKLWQTIFAGGPIATEAKLKGQKLTSQMYNQIGEWITNQLGPEVWVVLMPQAQEETVFVKGLKRTGQWKTVYIDDYQHMLVNILTPQGRLLLENVLAGKTAFPNTHSKSLTLFTAIIENKISGQYDILYPMIKEALAEFPTPATMSALINLDGFPMLSDTVTKDAQTYLDDFLQKREIYRKQDGYFQRLISARIAADFLAQAIPEKKNSYTSLKQDADNEADLLRETSVW